MERYEDQIGDEGESIFIPEPAVKEESVEAVPVFEFTFFNNHEKLFTIPTLTDEIPYEEFKSKYEEEFGYAREYGEVGDSCNIEEGKAVASE